MPRHGVIVPHPARPVIEDRRERGNGSEKPSRCYRFTAGGPLNFSRFSFEGNALLQSMRAEKVKVGHSSIRFFQ
jgi:hypothetical protein